MKTIPHLGKFLVLLLFSLFIVSCSKSDDNGDSGTDDDVSTTDDDGTGGSDDDPNGENSLPNIIELAETVDMLSSLLDAVDAADAGLEEALSGEGPFTVFAPTNDAFNDLLDQLEDFESLGDFEEDAEKELLAEILKYHVISGSAAFSADLSDGDVLETLQTETLTVNIDGSVFIQDKTENLAEVVGADNEASNGVVHIINKILLPQAVLDALFPKPNIVELVVETEELSLLEEAMLTAQLEDDLAAVGPFTLFAPTNAAIEELFELLGDSFSSFDDFDNIIELEILEQILLYHVVPGNITSTDLAPGTQATLLSGESIEIISSGETFLIGDASDVDANLVDIDKLASNGVVHIIDKILIPQEVQDFLDTLNPDDPTSGIPTIRELVEGSEEFAFLREALELTGLLETLGEEGPYTVFAPTNDTIDLLFGLLGGSLSSLEDFNLDFEIDLLRQVLSYHVLPGVVTSSDLTVGEVDTLLPGDQLEIGFEDGSFFLEDALGLNVEVLITDIPAGNGVIHTIDRILVPQSVIDTVVTEAESTVMAVLEELDDLDLCLSAFLMVRDKFEDALYEEFTFFLPNNQAFLELFDGLDGIDSLADFDTEEELRLLGEILAYHFIEGSKATSSDLFDQQELITLQGETLNINIDTSVYVIDKTGVPAKVTVPDTELLNGVIHIIDKVLLPQEVLDQLSS